MVFQKNYLNLKEQQVSGLDIEGVGAIIEENELFIQGMSGWQWSQVYGLRSATSSAYIQLEPGIHQ